MTSSKNSQSNPAPKKRRVTVSIPVVLDRALEIYCSGTRQLKSDVFAKAVLTHLAKQRKELEEALQKYNEGISAMFPSLPAGT